MKTALEIISALNLAPHPEGGYYRETYRSRESIEKEGLPSRYGDTRAFGTAIFYLLTPGTFSTMHILKSDEILHFYMGDPVEFLELYSDGSGKVFTMGLDIGNGIDPQHVVPQNTWFGFKLVKDGKYALMGATVAPGFDFNDFDMAERSNLIRSYPEFENEIISLTR